MFQGQKGVILNKNVECIHLEKESANFLIASECHECNNYFFLPLLKDFLVGKQMMSFIYNE